MYEVSINADPEHFLDWDKPLSEQHPKVQEAFVVLMTKSVRRIQGRLYGSHGERHGQKLLMEYVVVEANAASSGSTSAASVNNCS